MKSMREQETLRKITKRCDLYALADDRRHMQICHKFLKNNHSTFILNIFTLISQVYFTVWLRKWECSSLHKHGNTELIGILVPYKSVILTLRYRRRARSSKLVSTTYPIQLYGTPSQMERKEIRSLKTNREGPPCRILLSLSSIPLLEHQWFGLFIEWQSRWIICRLREATTGKTPVELEDSIIVYFPEFCRSGL